ncbi:unnamed protein product [Ixodes hexagonus]
MIIILSRRTSEEAGLSRKTVGNTAFETRERDHARVVRSWRAVHVSSVRSMVVPLHVVGALTSGIAHRPNSGVTSLQNHSFLLSLRSTSKSPPSISYRCGCKLRCPYCETNCCSDDAGVLFQHPMAQSPPMMQQHSSPQQMMMHSPPVTTSSYTADLMSAPAPSMSSPASSGGPMRDRPGVAFLPRQPCTRTGCPNPAIESHDWDQQYCSSECVVSHCRDVFTAWMTQRQSTNTFVK